MTPAPGLPFFAVELSHQSESEWVPVQWLPPTDTKNVKVTSARPLAGEPAEELANYVGIHEGVQPDGRAEIEIGDERYVVWATNAIAGTHVYFFAQLWRDFEKTLPPV